MSWPTPRRSCAGWRRAGRPRSRASTRSATSRRRSTSCGSRPTGRSARAIWCGPARSATARSPSCRVSSPGPTRRRARPPRWCRSEVGPNDIAEVVSNWTGIPVGRLLQGESEKLLADGVPARRAADRSEAGRQGGVRCRTAFAGRHLRPEPTDRFVPVPRPDRRRQDRAGQGAGGVPVRRRARHDPDRHERVLREALGGPAGRRPSGLRRLRGGRPAHRGGAAAPVRGRAAGRGGEGAQRGLRHLAAGAGRRSADRRPGPDGRLPQRVADLDLEPRLAVPGRPDAGRRDEAERGDGCRARARSSRSS